MHPRCSIVGLGIAAFALACGGSDRSAETKPADSTSRSPTATRADSAAGSRESIAAAVPTPPTSATPAAGGTPPATAPATAPTPAPSPAPSAADLRLGRTLDGPDSAIRIQMATQPEFRTRADSISLVAAIRRGLKHDGWPVQTARPLPGSVLPGKRIVAFYGNPLSKRMGILGEIPYANMLAKLDTVVGWWRQADPATPVVPALHLIVSVAQADAGKDGMYRQRSNPALIEKVYNFAKEKNALTILDIQTGKSTLREEVPVLLPFLQRPDVHLGIDPEFNMHNNREGRRPGTKIGAMTADDVNGVIAQLAAIVSKYNLPPKVLIIHRFTTNMLQNADQIRLDPRVQVVINMDGWGQPWHKFDTYATCEATEPVQFTGFKIFFHNDTRKGDRILAPSEVLALRPRPIYIQYQ